MKLNCRKDFLSVSYVIEIMNYHVAYLGSG